MSNLYNVIAQLCKTKGISGYRLCKEIGIQPSILTDLKVGRKQTLSAETLSKIAVYFGVSVDYLLGKEESDWSFAFRQNLLEAISSYDSYDYIEVGVDENWLYAVANGDIPLTFKTACDVADVLGESFDSLLGRDCISQAEETEKAPTRISECSISDEELKFALWGDCQDIDEDDLEDVRRYAAFVRERKRKK